ncbi:TolB family protein [Bacteroidota bacterium]
MIRKENKIGIVILFIVLISCSTDQSQFPVLRGLYLGQNPPGDVPELFAPGIVSSVYLEHGSAVFTPDGKEVFWSREINLGREPRIIVIMHMKQENGVWSKPELAPFNFNDAAYNHINSISPDGKCLYYFTWSEKRGRKVWVVDKTENDWGDPHVIEKCLTGSEEDINEVHETRSGNLYCTGPLASSPRGWGIVRTRFADGKYQEYESLGADVNFNCDDPYPNHSPTVDPDERFVIFVSRRPGGYGTQDLYISYRQSDDTFGPAINLGHKINTIGKGNSWPQLSPDGKYLFFVGYSHTQNEEDILRRKYSYDELIKREESIYNGLGNIYWVSTSFIQDLKPDELK